MISKIVIEPGHVSSHIENEEYFPLRVIYDPSHDSSIGSNRYVGFYYEDSDLLEFTVDMESGLIREMQIIVCNHYQFVDDDYQSEHADDSIIRLKYDQHNDCELFKLTVFKNAIHIMLSNKTASVFTNSGQVTFGISSSGELVSVLINEMTEKDIAHSREELTIGTDQ